MTPILTTERLLLRECVDADAAFIHKLYTGDDFLRAIGDRGIASESDARAYVNNVLRRSYAQHGFGLWLMEHNGEAIGVCGLVKRDYLPLPDLGFALLPDYYGFGFAAEAARGSLAYAQQQLGLQELLAIANMDNSASHKLLQAVGFEMDEVIVETYSKASLCCFRWQGVRT